MITDYVYNPTGKEIETHLKEWKERFSLPDKHACQKWCTDEQSWVDTHVGNSWWFNEDKKFSWLNYPQYGIRLVPHPGHEIVSEGRVEWVQVRPGEYRLLLDHKYDMTSMLYDIPDPKLLEEINECFNQES